MFLFVKSVDMLESIALIKLVSHQKHYVGCYCVEIIYFL